MTIDHLRMESVPFDPSAWLAAFRAADGYWVVTPGSTSFGWYCDGLEEQARELWREIEGNAERRAAIRAVALASSEGKG